MITEIFASILPRNVLSPLHSFTANFDQHSAAKSYVMNLLKNGWFSNIDLLPDTCLSFEVQDIVHKEKSKFQDIMVINTHGRAVALDGIIQWMEDDEFSYNEMLTFLPLCCHPHPKKVLLIGGGSGGSVRQIIKHPTVEVVDVVEIDETFIEVSKRFLPSMTAAYEDSRVNLFIEDGVEYLKRNESKKYDVIITDSSGPVGPSAPLHGEEYFQMIKKALNPAGVISVQAGSLWLYSKNPKIFNLPTASYEDCKRIFGNAAYASLLVPSYETGQIGVVVASTNLEVDLKKPVFEFPEGVLEKRNILYYSPSVHQAAFVLPRCYQKLFS